MIKEKVEIKLVECVKKLNEAGKLMKQIKFSNVVDEWFEGEIEMIVENVENLKSDFKEYYRMEIKEGTPIKVILT